MRQQAFTLIEPSIVLVIIGLITEGILAGRDLIHAAEIRATVRQLEEFETAVGAFKAKYGCLPGDCPNASDFGFVATTNGTGDGLIDMSGDVQCSYAYGGCSDQVNGEYSNFWYHLSAAGLIAFTGKPYDVADFPTNITPGVVTPPVKLQSPFVGLVGWNVVAGVIFDASAGNSVMGPHVFGLPGTSTYGGPNRLYFVEDVYAVDAKIDDGFPFSGKARVRAEFNGYDANHVPTFGASLGPGGPGTTRCVRNETTPYQYNILNAKTNSSLCGLAIKAGF